LVLVASACGSRLSEEELAETNGGGGGGGSQETGGGNGSSGGEGGEGGEELPMPCGEGEAPPSGNPDKGVTADRINIAVISDKSGQVKVPTASVEESVAAFVELCNAEGGINGRQLELTKIDAKLFQHLEATQQACNDDIFALVGSGAVSDNQGAQAMVDCGLIEVAAYAATPAKALSERVVQAVPNNTNFYNVGPARYIAETFPDAITSAGLSWGDIDVAETQARRTQEAYETEGFEFKVTEATPVIQDSYVSTVEQLEDEEIGYVAQISALSETQKLLRDMQTQGFEPEVVDLGQQYYDPELASSPGAEGALVLTNTVPFEEADNSPAMQRYLDAFEQIGANVEPTSLGVQAFSAALLFATAAAEVPPDQLKRDAVLEQLKTVTEWDGGGLHMPGNPGENSAPTCFLYMKVEGGEFVREHPEEGFDCAADYAIELRGDYGEGAKAQG
jgi:ABC-type branched-subunit amino acid transport system substrate-binding protein